MATLWVFGDGTGGVARRAFSGTSKNKLCLIFDFRQCGNFRRQTMSQRQEDRRIHRAETKLLET